MAIVIHIHPRNPQPRLIEQAAALIARGAVAVYPTDSNYALGCQLGNKHGVDRIRQIRSLNKQHEFSLLCRNLTEIASYARIDNRLFRFIKAHTPGPYTFILPATKQVPRRLLQPKRKTIGIRIPDEEIALAILAQLDQPLMSVTLQLPADPHPLTNPDDINEKIGVQVDLVVAGAVGGIEPTTVVDLTMGVPTIVRQGKGDTRDF